MRKQTVLALAVVCLTVASVVALPGTVQADSSTTLELQAADSTDTDSSTVSFTFSTKENATSVDIQGTYSSSGGVTFEFDEWEELGGSGSGTTSSFSAEGRTTYEITYTVEASSNADERTYSTSPSVSIQYDDKGPETFSETLRATVEILEPEFGPIDDRSDDRTFEPDDGSTLEWRTFIDISNVGDGYMDVDDVSISGTPRAMSVSANGVPDRVTSESSDRAILDIEVDDSISEGTHSFSVTVTDSLGNSESATVTVDISKPPAVGTGEETVDVGQILVGEDGTATVTLTERNGYTDISGVQASVESDDSQGSISFPGLDGRSIRADGSVTQTVEIDVDENAQQGEQLRWEVSFTPNADDGIAAEETVTFTAEVLYPPYYEELSMSDSQLVFDEPRDETDTFTDRVTVDLANGGDLPMELRDVSASVPNNPEIDARVVGGPDTVGAGSTGTMTVEVRASSDSSAGSWNVELDVTANEPTTAPNVQTGTATVTSNVGVDHETELEVDQTSVEAGEIIVTEQVSETVNIRERLGYQAVANFSLRQTAGPEQGWLTVTQSPERLNAGQQEAFGVTIQFDTSAELYETYTWEFAVGGSNVETSTITIQAVPEPVNFAETISELETIGAETSGESETVALEMAGALDELEQLLQEGDGGATRSDITVMVTAARSSVLLIEAAGEAESLMDAENYSQAQRPLVQATSAFNTFSVAVDDVDSSEIESRTEEIQASAEAIVSGLIERQESYYLTQLEEGDPTMLEEAQTKRELARVVALSGDKQRATELREEAQTAFDSYSELISDGNEELIAARELREKMDEELFLSPGGFRLFLISSLSTYNADSESVLDHYDTAIENFEAAGATERAEVAAAERADIASDYENAYLLSIGLGVALGVVLLVFLIWEIRALYRYRLDAEDAVTGDFLLPWAETES